jgi:hypothetical protein
MAGQEGLEPPAAGFGVRSSTIRATGLCSTQQHLNAFRLCFGFLMCRVLAAESAILVQVQLIRGIPLVFGR